MDDRCYLNRIVGLSREVKNPQHTPNFSIIFSTNPRRTSTEFYTKYNNNLQLNTTQLIHHTTNSKYIRSSKYRIKYFIIQQKETNNFIDRLKKYPKTPNFILVDFPPQKTLLPVSNPSRSS